MNVRKALAVLGKGYESKTGITYEGYKLLRETLEALASTEECFIAPCVHNFDRDGILLTGQKYEYCSKCGLHQILGSKPDPIREVYEKYNKPGVMIDTIHGLSEIWQAVCKHCQSKGEV